MTTHTPFRLLGSGVQLLAAALLLAGCDSLVGVTLRGRLPLLGTTRQAAEQCLERSFGRHSEQPLVKHAQNGAARYDVTFKELPFEAVVTNAAAGPSGAVDVSFDARELNAQLSDEELAHRKEVLEHFASAVGHDCPGLTVTAK